MLASSHLDYAVILAGGLGTRLRPLTSSCPKSLVEVNGRPFIEHQLQLLRRNGITRVLLLLGHLGLQIEAHLGDGSQWGIAIDYSYEQVPLGTAGALLHADRKLPASFFLIYGDVYLDFDYQAAAGRLLNSAGPESLAMMAVIPVCKSDSDVFGQPEPGNARMDTNRKIITRYSKGSGDGYDHLDAGVLIFNRDILKMIPEGKADLEEHVYPALAASGQLLAFPCTGGSHDIGQPKRLMEFAHFIGSQAR